ncbi:MAG TPA: hypothetical protein VL122_10930 [Nitrospirota bacterium]|nr:hypothetical protein [Nitrospirota bacterium]
MKKWLSIIVAAGLLLYPFAAFSEDYGSPISQTQQSPPVAQTLIREGDFAIKLAAKLNLGLPANETEAEELLSKIEIVPQNGWLSDYPVTPEIIGQLRSAIAKSSADGKLPMNADAATKGLYSLTQELNQPIPAPEGSSPPEQDQTTTSSTSPADINNYYYEQGPPIITYYPPPPDYDYLYDWVPYPVLWFGFWFPGFYICNNFTTIVVTGFFDHDGHHEHWRRGLVTNRIIDPVTRSVAAVVPVTRTSAGVVRPVMALRTAGGNTFRTLPDLRQWARDHGTRTGAAGTFGNAPFRSRGFGSVEARRSAGNIYLNSIERTRANQMHQDVIARGSEPRFSAPGSSRRLYRPAPLEQRQFTPSRIPERSFSASLARSGQGAARSFTGNGWGARGYGGRRFSGGMCRGRC